MPLFKPTPVLIALAVVGALFMLYNFYRGWFCLKDTRANMERMLSEMPPDSKLGGFFRRRLESPTWELETRVTSLINLALMLIIAGIVFYAALINR